MLRAIVSVTTTRSWDSTPVPATKPCSSAFMRVTGDAGGFLTPEVQPATSAAVVKARVSLAMVFMCLLSVKIKFNHGWTQMNTDGGNKCAVSGRKSVLIRVHPWLKFGSKRRRIRHTGRVGDLRARGQV